MKSLAGNGIRSGDPRPSPVPTRPPRREREPALRELAVADVVHRGGFERVQPVRHAVLHVGERHVPDRAAGREEEPAGEEVAEPPARDPQHDDEDPEEEHRGSEVAFQEQDREGGGPREQQRAQVLGSRESEPSDARLEELPLRGEVRREEDDDQDLPELRGLERERTELRPQARPVDRQSDPRYHREQQQHQAEEPDRVRVAVEDAVVAYDQEGEHERGQPDQEPEGLLVRDVGGEQPVDHREPEPSEHPRDREQHGIRPGCDPSHDTPRQEVRPAEGEPVDDDVARDATSQPEPDHAVGGDRRHEGDEQQQEPGLRARRRGGEGAHGVPPRHPDLVARRARSAGPLGPLGHRPR